jgi:hypothetical protein
MRTPFFSVIAASIFLVSCQNTGDFASKSSNETPLPDSAIAAKDGSGEDVDALATAAIDKDKHGGQVQKLFAVYKAPPTGARFTWRSNWASMPDLVTYEVQGVVERGGAEYVALKSVKGLAETTYAYYDTTNFSLKGYRNEQDEALTTFKPVEERYRFPLEKGKQWVSEWKMKDHKTGKVTSGGGVFKIISLELLKLPAGNFQTARVRLPVAPGLPKGMTHYVWFAPKLGITVKEQIGNGQMNWTQVLEAVELPGES